MHCQSLKLVFAKHMSADCSQAKGNERGGGGEEGVILDLNQIKRARKGNICICCFLLHLPNKCAVFKLYKVWVAPSEYQIATCYAWSKTVENEKRKINFAAFRILVVWSKYSELNSTRDVGIEHERKEFIVFAPPLSFTLNKRLW